MFCSTKGKGKGKVWYWLWSWFKHAWWLLVNSAVFL